MVLTAERNKKHKEWLKIHFGLDLTLLGYDNKLLQIKYHIVKHKQLTPTHPEGEASQPSSPSALFLTTASCTAPGGGALWMNKLSTTSQDCKKTLCPGGRIQGTLKTVLTSLILQQFSFSPCTCLTLVSMLCVVLELYPCKHGSKISFQRKKAVPLHRWHLEGNNLGDLQQTEEDHSNSQQRLQVAAGNYLHSSKIQKMHPSLVCCKSILRCSLSLG